MRVLESPGKVLGFLYLNSGNTLIYVSACMHHLFVYCLCLCLTVNVHEIMVSSCNFRFRFLYSILYFLLGFTVRLELFVLLLYRINSLFH